jgi:hypothetical protein
MSDFLPEPGAATQSGSFQSCGGYQLVAAAPHLAESDLVNVF